MYVSDNKFMMHESIPGLPGSPSVVGVPIAWVVHGVKSLKPVNMRFQLGTQHLRRAGFKDIPDNYIHDSVLGVAIEDAMPAWRMKVIAAYEMRGQSYLGMHHVI